VGHNSLTEARKLAAHAQRIGADAVAAAPPSYFKPASAGLLADSLAEVASAAPDLPFYYYHIPSMTGVDLDMIEILRRAGRLPTLEGIKYTDSRVDQFQELVEFEDGQFDIVYGRDEMLLAGLSAGARGAIGSTYNFAAPLYRRLIEAFDRGELAEARRWQSRSVAMIRTLLQHGGQQAFKAVMSLIGLDCGPARLPQASLDPAGLRELRAELEAIGFFDWARSGPES